MRYAEIQGNQENLYQELGLTSSPNSRITQCPFCHQKLSIISADSRSGYCNNCGVWLGSEEPTQFTDYFFDPEEIKLQEELFLLFGKLITYTPEAYSNISKKRNQQIIAYFQLKELESIEALNQRIITRRIYKAMTYTGRTAKDFWKEFSHSL